MNMHAKKLRSVFVVGFLLTVALALTGYIDSSFLGNFIDVKSVGLLFSVGSLVSIIMLSYMPSILGRIGVTGVFNLTAIAYLLSILGMVNTGVPLIFQLLFIFYLASGIGIYFVIDMLIEHYSTDGSTGITRGFYLAIYNLAYLLGPLLAGILLKNNSFEMVYLLAGVFVIIMALVYMRDFKRMNFHPHHNGFPFLSNVLRMTKNDGLFHVYIVSLMLSFFFSWMSIYTPIYLNQFIGFDWGAIGAMFALMHVPYITLEIPFGRLADRFGIEREFMMTGLVIVGLSTAYLATLTEANFWFWVAGLIVTRVGASFIQVSSESYFFKRVSDKDSDMIAIFRNASPVAYIVGPVMATLALSFTSYRGLFVVLGAIMLAVVLVAAKLNKREITWKHSR